MQFAVWKKCLQPCRQTSSRSLLVFINCSIWGQHWRRGGHSGAALYSPASTSCTSAVLINNSLSNQRWFQLIYWKIFPQQWYNWPKYLFLQMLPHLHPLYHPFTNNIWFIYLLCHVGFEWLQLIQYTLKQTCSTHDFKSGNLSAVNWWLVICSKRAKMCKHSLAFRKSVPYLKQQTKTFLTRRTFQIMLENKLPHIQTISAKCHKQGVNTTVTPSSCAAVCIRYTALRKIIKPEQGVSSGYVSVFTSHKSFQLIISVIFNYPTYAQMSPNMIGYIFHLWGHAFKSKNPEFKTLC